MTIEFLKIQNEGSKSFHIWIDGEQNFNEDEFLLIISELEILKQQRVLTSVAPAEYIDELHTKLGILTVHQEFDSFAATTISSNSIELMDNVLAEMIASGKYCEKNK